MKKAIIICIGLFNSFFCSGQENYCSGAELYSLVFKELNLYKNKATEIEIGYKFDETIVQIIGKLKIFSENEMDQFKKTHGNIHYSDCDDLKKEVISIIDKDKIKEDGSYMEFVFSNVISLSDSKKCILLINVIKNIKYEGGKPVGDEVIFILEKENDKWKLTDKKPIGMY